MYFIFLGTSSSSMAMNTDSMKEEKRVKTEILYEEASDDPDFDMSNKMKKERKSGGSRKRPSDTNAGAKNKKPKVIYNWIEWKYWIERKYYTF